MRLCLFSISYAGTWGQHRLDVENLIAHAAGLGYESVMLAGKRPHLSPLDATGERIASIRAALEKHKIQCAVIGAYTDFSAQGAAEVPHMELQIAYVESLARIAAELGSKIVRVFTAYENEKEPIHATWQRVVAALREICDRVSRHGVTIAVQNHHDLAVHSEAMLELLADIDRPNCRLGFDAWSPALRGENLYESARKMAPHTVVTTNADYIRLPRFCYQPSLVNYAPADDLVRAVKFGDGFIDYRGFFKGLRDGGFDGIATYEMCSPLRGGGSIENLDACARQYVRWMKENELAG